MKELAKERMEALSGKMEGLGVTVENLDYVAAFRLARLFYGRENYQVCIDFCNAIEKAIS